MNPLLPAFLSLRYIRSQGDQRFFSLMSWVSCLSLVLGVAAMTIVLSVLNGFSGELERRILKVIPHGHLEWDQDGQDWQGIARMLRQGEKEVVGVAPALDGKVLLLSGGQMTAAEMKGISLQHEASVSGVANSLIAGETDALVDGAFGLVLGHGLARQLGVGLGDPVKVMLPDFSVTPAGIFPRYKRFTVRGIFYVGAQPDATLAMTDLVSAAKFFRRYGQDGVNVKKLTVKTSDIHRAETIIKNLKIQDLGPSMRKSSWQEHYQTLFRAIKMERMVIAIILSSVILVAAFNISSLLVMMVSEKRMDVAMLRIMGMREKHIGQVFIVQALLIALFGIGFGVILGVVISENMEAIFSGIEYSISFLTSGYFEISLVRFPSKLLVHDVFAIAIFSLVLCMLASLYPAIRASRIDPIHSLND